MEISINTAGATKRELLLVAGLFTSLADVTEYARTTQTDPLPVVDFKPEKIHRHVQTEAVSVETSENLVVTTTAVYDKSPEPLQEDEDRSPDLASRFAATVTPPANVPVPTAPAVPLPPFVPPAPPAESAPSQHSAAAAGTAAPDERDTDGLPWDERIHSGTKNKNADGRWKSRRGLNDPALVARVKAELLGVSVTPAAVAPPAAAVPPPPPPVPIISGVVPTDFPSLCLAMTPLKATQEQIAEALRCVGAESLPMLGIQQAAKIPAFWAALMEEVQ